jgi:hypothetical protein
MATSKTVLPGRPQAARRARNRKRRPRTRARRPARALHQAGIRASASCAPRCWAWNARRRDEHDGVDIRRFEFCGIKRSGNESLEQRACTCDIRGRALLPAMRLVEPSQRSGEIPSAMREPKYRRAPSAATA